MIDELLIEHRQKQSRMYVGQDWVQIAFIIRLPLFYEGRNIINCVTLSIFHNSTNALVNGTDSDELQTVGI